MDQRVHRIALALHGAGWEVTVVGRMMKGSGPLSDRPYKTKRFRLLFSRGKFFYAAYNLRLLRYLLFHRAEVLHANDLDTLWPNAIAARRRGSALVYDSHEYFTEVPELVNRPRTRAFWLRLEQRLFPSLKKVMTVNESLAAIYEDRYQVPVISIRNLPLKTTAVGGPQRKRILLYQGAVNEGRGVDLMIQAMEHLPGYQLRILGGGPRLEAMKTLAAAQPFRDQIHFSGWLPFEQLAPLTREAALGLSLEENKGENYRIASPNKIYDYIQAGVPVLSSDLPEMKKVVSEYEVGAVLSQRDPRVLAEMVRSMVEDETVWNRYYQNCLRAREVLTWENEKERLLSWYPVPEDAAAKA